MTTPLDRIIRTAAVVCTLTFAAWCVPAEGVAAEYKLRVAADRPEAIYKVGDKARFVVTLTVDGKPVKDGKVVYVVDEFISRPASSTRGERAVTGRPVTIEATSEKPIFVRCTVLYVTPEKKRLQAVAGVGFSPRRIRPSLPIPDDFDEFWAGQKKQLAAIPLKPELTPVPADDDGISRFDVQVPCLGGAPVSGYFARPKNAKPRSLPAILWVHGAGVRSSNLGNAVAGAKAGMLSMDINAHGIPNGKPAAFYAQLSRGKLRDYRHAGRDKRETIYFRGMYLRLVRAIDFLTSQPEWDGKTVAVIGHSQGGGQALVAGGLDPRVTIIAAGVPAICDHSGRVVGRVNGWPKIVPMGDDGKPDPKILQAARYIDAVNFAGRCKAEAIMSVGFVDAVCPPSSCYAAFNNLQGKKQVINKPLMGHAAPKPIRDAFFKAILAHARRQSAR